MQNGKLFIDLDDALAKAEIASEKGRYQGCQLYEDLAEEITDEQKVYSWDRIRIMSEIAFDYAFEVDRSLKEARELFSALWERTKEQEEKNNCAGEKQKGEEYREQISYMLSRIQDEAYLRRIFTVVHAGFLKRGEETP